MGKEEEIKRMIKILKANIEIGERDNQLLRQTAAELKTQNELLRGMLRSADAGKANHEI